jgi:hypothetical protein
MCWGWGGAGDAISGGAYLDVAITEATTCALNANGNVHCWNERQPPSPPLGEFQALTASSYAFGAISISGALAFWDGDTEDHTAVIRTGAPTGNFVALAMDDAFACAIDTAGLLQCWGDDAPDLERLKRVARP